MGDFTTGDFGKAFSSLASTIVTFILIPLSIFALMEGIMTYASGSGLGMFDPDMLDQLVGVTQETLERAIKYSIPFLVIAIPMGFYARGNIAKVPFRLIWAVYMMIWMWMILQGGVFTTAMHDIGIETINISTISIALDLTFIIYITLMVCVTKGFLAFSEYGSYHKEYVEELEERKEKKEKKSRKGKKEHAE